jgi:hypothetical protein
VCPSAGFVVEVASFANSELQLWDYLEKLALVVRTRRGWNWFRAVSNGGAGILGVHPSDSAARELVDLKKISLRMTRGWNCLRVVSSSRLWY